MSYSELYHSVLIGYWLLPHLLVEAGVNPRDLSQKNHQITQYQASQVFALKKDRLKVASCAFRAPIMNTIKRLWIGHQLRALDQSELIAS